jgi:hypothetical protein
MDRSVSRRKAHRPGWHRDDSQHPFQDTRSVWSAMPPGSIVTGRSILGCPRCAGTAVVAVWGQCEHGEPMLAGQECATCGLLLTTFEAT